MRTGLYEYKYHARKWISFILPLFAAVSPTALTLLLFPIGVLTAIWYFLAIHFDWVLGFALGMLFIVFRTVIGTLDGYVAEAYDRCTPVGRLLNRLAPEVCDVLYLTALCLAAPSFWGFAALSTGWISSFLGILPSLVEKKSISVGPVGQTDRLAALMLFSFLQFFVYFPVDYFFMWCLFGGALTIIFRTFKLFRYENPSKTSQKRD